MPLWLVIADPILFAALCYFTWHWRKEWNFYSRNNRNFLIDNPNAKQMYHGADGSLDEKNRMSNYQRVYWGYPFFVFVTGVIFLAFTYFIYRIHACPFDEVIKCGIDVKNGRITFSG
jgi:hypothetical protein